MCLFHALVGEEDDTGAIAERDGQAAALRMRAGELMASGYAKRLSRDVRSRRIASQDEEMDQGDEGVGIRPQCTAAHGGLRMGACAY